MGQQPKYVGVMTLKQGQAFDVLVVDQLPDGKQFAFVVTPETFKGIRHLIEAPPEVTVAEETIPSNVVPVEMDRDYKSAPDANKWSSVDEGSNILFGCPRCGTNYPLILPFRIGPEGMVEPSFKCTKCGTHRFLRLKDFAEPVIESN